MSAPKTYTWRKIERGFYVLPGTRYGVAVDGYSAIQSNQATSRYEGFQGGEWATIEFPSVVSMDDPPSHNDGANVDWFPTMRDAKALAESMARRSA